MRHNLAVLVAFLTFAAAPANAGIVDSPLPVLSAGQKTQHVFSVPGIVIGAYGIDSFFSCTSLDKVPIRVGVEVFNGSGSLVNDATATSALLAPGATVIFATATSAGIFPVVDLDVPTLARGSARILATSTKFACTAFLADSVNVPPTSMVSLTIIAKTKQKAAN